jgi:hypothetical protein
MTKLQKIIDNYPRPYMIIMHAKIEGVRFASGQPIFYMPGLSTSIGILLKQGLRNKLKLLKDNLNK